MKPWGQHKVFAQAPSAFCSALQTPVMEMDLQNLDPRDLPEQELAFIRRVMQSSRPFYLTGFMGEQAIQGAFAAQYRSLNQCTNVALLRTGSGGRYEGGGLGESGLILLSRSSSDVNSLPPSDLPTLLRVLNRPVGLGMMTFEVEDVEHKDLDGGSPLSFYGSATRPYPGRILEAELVAGNRALFEEARLRVLQEVLSDPRILQGLRALAKEHRKVMTTGVGRFGGSSLRYVDLEQGIIHYDPENNLFGLKYGPIRFAQTALAADILSFAARRHLPPAELGDLPQSVEERCRFCLRKGWVTGVDRMSDMALAYSEALDLQIRTKFVYLSGQAREMKVTPTTLAGMNETLLNTLKDTMLVT